MRTLGVPPARLAVLVLLLAAAGCLPSPRGGGWFGSGGAERQRFEEATRVAARDPVLGRIRLSQFLAAHPRSSLADDAGLALARLERAAGREAEAERVLRAALAAQPRGDRSDAVRLELARGLAARGDAEGAWQEAQRVRLPLLAPSERREAERLLAELARGRGDHAHALAALVRLRAEADAGEAEALDAAIAEAMAALPTDALAQAAEGLGTRPPAGRVWLEVAERALAERASARALRALGRADRVGLDAADEARRARLAARLGMAPAPEAYTESGRFELPPRLADVEGGAALPDAAAASGALGVVLPLSGPFAGVAERSLRGVLLAAGVFGGAADGGAGPGALRVYVRDSAGSPERAAAAVRELAARGAAAVVGPLLAEEAQAVGAAAAETGIPVVALTREESVVRSGAPVFRVGLTRRMEAEVLAAHAVHDLGLRRFAILHPDDDYGREFEARLWQALEARGARVVAVAGYAPSAADFTGPIRSLVGWSLLSEAEQAEVARRRQEAAASAPAAARPLWSDSVELGAEGAAGGTEPLPPLVDFDALFLPDAADKVALIVPQLAAESVEGVTLLGSSAWHHPDLVRSAGPRLEGAFFTSAFDPSHPAPLVQEFVRRHTAAYGGPPDAFAALGFDAASLVVLQLLRGATSPEDLRRGLLDTRLHPGVSGVTSVDPDGNARKRPFLVGVRAGALVSLE